MRTSLTLPALLSGAALFTALAGAFAPEADAQATRTWVSGVGDDANPCSRTAPCKTLAGSISKTAGGGEINGIDGGGFGAVTITKAITIDLTAVEGGVLNSGAANGIVVNAAATDDVVLRGLDIDGAGGGSVPACGYGGGDGVRVLNARTVNIEDSRIVQQQNGIELKPANPVSVLVNRVEFANNCLHGIDSVPAVGGSVDLTVRGSTIAHSGTALSVADRSSAWLTGSTIFNNALGLQTLGTGVINDFGDNQMISNTIDGAPTGHVGPAAVPGPQGATGPAGVQGTPGVKLLVAASSSRLFGKVGRRVSMRYAATATGASTLAVSRAGKRVATVRATAVSGANTIRWSARTHGHAARAGRYRLTLRIVGAGGQTDTTAAWLKLARR